MAALTGTGSAEVVASTSTVRREAMVVVAAGTIAMLTWLAARAAGVELSVRSGSGSCEVGLASAMVTAGAAAVAGTGLLHLLERRPGHGVRRWTVVAATVWALSFAGPVSATSASAGAALATMHLLVGAVVLGGLRRSRVA